MAKQRTAKDYLFLVLKGLGMGAANKVPGVSGGIVAFVGGFYEEFIYSLQKINGKAFLLLRKGRYKSFFTYINARFLAMLVLGMLISYFSISKLLDYFIVKKELYVWASFFGMILGSVYYVAKDLEYWSKKMSFWVLIGTTIGLAISFLNPAKENDNLFFIFFCGIISVSGMTLPGLSGSFILMLLGNYVLLLVDAVNSLSDTFSELLVADFSVIHHSERLKMLRILGVFTLGSVVGLVSLSHILSYVLKRFKNTTTALILGFISGSLGVVWPWKKALYKTGLQQEIITDSNGKKIIENYQRYLPDLSLGETWIAFGFIIFGILIILVLDWYGSKTREHKKPIRPGG